MDRSIYILPYVPLRDQVSSLLDRQLVEEAVLLAETIAAVEAAKEKESPEEVLLWKLVYCSHPAVPAVYERGEAKSSVHLPW